MAYTMKLVDFITNTYETTFGTCDMCMHTGQATDETFVFELGSGRRIEADNTYWDWGDHCTAMNVSNTADFAHWLSKQTFAGDEPDDITYSMLSELGGHYYDYTERERHRNDPVDLLRFNVELYLKDDVVLDAAALTTTAENLDKTASELIPDMEIIQQYEILGSYEAPVDIAGVSQSTLDDIDPTKIILLVSCRQLYINDITIDPATYVSRVRDFIQQCVDAYSECGFSAQVGSTLEGSLVGPKSPGSIKYLEYGVEKVAEIFVRPGETEVCFNYQYNEDEDSDGAVRLTY